MGDIYEYIISSSEFDDTFSITKDSFKDKNQIVRKNNSHDNEDKKVYFYSYNNITEYLDSDENTHILQTVSAIGKNPNSGYRYFDIDDIGCSIITTYSSESKHYQYDKTYYTLKVIYPTSLSIDWKGYNNMIPKPNTIEHIEEDGKLSYIICIDASEEFDQDNKNIHKEVLLKYPDSKFINYKVTGIDYNSYFNPTFLYKYEESEWNNYINNDNGVKMFNTSTGVLAINSAYVHNGQQCTLYSYIYYEKNNKVSSFFCPGPDRYNLNNPQTLEVKYQFIKHLPMKFNAPEGKQIIYLNELIEKRNKETNEGKQEYSDGTIINVTTSDIQYTPIQIVLRLNNGNGVYNQSTSPDIVVQYNNKYITGSNNSGILTFSASQIIALSSPRNLIITNNNLAYKIKRITDENGHTSDEINSTSLKLALTSALSKITEAKFLTYKNIEYSNPFNEGNYIGTRIYIDFDKATSINNDENNGGNNSGNNENNNENNNGYNKYYTKINLKLLDTNNNPISISNVQSAIINIANVSGKSYNYDSSSSGNVLVFIIPYSYQNYKHQIQITFKNIYTSYISSQFSFSIKNDAPVPNTFLSSPDSSNGSIIIDGNIISPYYSFNKDITISSNTTSIRIRLYNKGITKEIGLNNITFKIYQSNTASLSDADDLTNSNHITKKINGVPESNAFDGNGFCYISNAANITKSYVIIKLINSKYRFVNNGVYTDNISVPYSNIKNKLNGAISIKANVFYKIDTDIIKNSKDIIYPPFHPGQNLYTLDISPINFDDPIIKNNILIDGYYKKFESTKLYFCNKLTSLNILATYGIYRIIDETDDYFNYGTTLSTNITNVSITDSQYIISNSKVDKSTSIPITKYYYGYVRDTYQNFSNVSLFLDGKVKTNNDYILIGTFKNTNQVSIIPIVDSTQYYCKVLLSCIGYESSVRRSSSIVMMDSMADSLYINTNESTILGTSNQIYYGGKSISFEEPKVVTRKSVIESIEEEIEETTENNIEIKEETKEIVFGAENDESLSVYPNAISTEKANADERHGIYTDIQIENMSELILPTDISVFDRNQIEYISSNPSVVDIIYFDYDPITGNEISLENTTLDEENGHYIKPKLNVLSVGESTITARYNNTDNDDNKGYAQTQVQYQVIVKEKKVAKISLDQDEYEVTRKIAENIDEDEYNNDPLVANQYFQSPTPTITSEEAIPAEFGYSSSNVQIASHYQLGIILIYGIGQVKVTIYLKESKYYKSAEVSYILKIVLPPPKTTTILEVPEAYYKVRFKEYTDIDTYRLYDYYNNDNDCHIVLETNDASVIKNLGDLGLTMRILSTPKSIENPRIHDYKITSFITYIFMLNDGITSLEDKGLSINGRVSVTNYEELINSTDDFNGNVCLFDLENIEYDEYFQSAKVKLNCSVVLNANGTGNIKYFIFPKSVSNRLDVDANSFIKKSNGIYIDKHLRPITKKFGNENLPTYPVYGPNFETYGIQYYDDGLLISLKHARLNNAGESEIYKIHNDGDNTFYVYAKDTISDLDTLMVRHNFNDEELKYQIFKTEFTSNNTDDDVEYQFSSSIPNIAKPNTNGNVIIYKVGKVKIMINSSETKNFTAAETGYILDVIAKEEPVLEINQDTFIYYMDTYTDYDGTPYQHYVVKDNKWVLEDYHGEDDPNSLVNIFECPEVNWKNTDENSLLEYLLHDGGEYTDFSNMIDIDIITNTETETSSESETEQQDNNTYKLYISATDSYNLKEVSISKEIFNNLVNNKHILDREKYGSQIQSYKNDDNDTDHYVTIINIPIYIYAKNISRDPIYIYDNLGGQFKEKYPLNNYTNAIDKLIKYLDGIGENRNRIKNKFAFLDVSFSPHTSENLGKLFNDKYIYNPSNLISNADGWTLEFNEADKKIYFKCVLNAAVFYSNVDDLNSNKIKLGYILPYSTCNDIIYDIINQQDIITQQRRIKTTTDLNGFYIDTSMSRYTEGDTSNTPNESGTSFRCFSHKYKYNYLENDNNINYHGTINGAKTWISGNNNELVFNGDIIGTDIIDSNDNLLSAREPINELLYQHFYRYEGIEQEELGPEDIVYGSENEEEVNLPSQVNISEFVKQLIINKNKEYKVSIDDNGDINIQNGLVNHIINVLIKSHETDNFKAKSKLYNLVILPKEKPKFGIHPQEVVIKIGNNDKAAKKQFIESPKIICDNKDGNATLKFEFANPNQWYYDETLETFIKTKIEIATDKFIEVDGNGNISLDPITWSDLGGIDNPTETESQSETETNNETDTGNIEEEELGSEDIVYGDGETESVTCTVTINNNAKTIYLSDSRHICFCLYKNGTFKRLTNGKLYNNGTAVTVFNFGKNGPYSLVFSKVETRNEIPTDWIGANFASSRQREGYNSNVAFYQGNGSDFTGYIGDEIYSELTFEEGASYTINISRLTEFTDNSSSSSTPSTQSTDTSESTSTDTSESSNSSSDSSSSSSSSSFNTSTQIDIKSNYDHPISDSGGAGTSGNPDSKEPKESTNEKRFVINVISPGTKNYAYARKQFTLVLKEKGTPGYYISSTSLELVKTVAGTQTFAGPTVIPKAGEDTPNIYYESSNPGVVGVTSDGTLLVYGNTNEEYIEITVKFGETDNYKETSFKYTVKVDENIMAYNLEGNVDVDSNTNGDETIDGQNFWWGNNYYVDIAIDDYMVNFAQMCALTAGEDSNADVPNFEENFTI